MRVSVFIGDVALATYKYIHTSLCAFLVAALAAQFIQLSSLLFGSYTDGHVPQKTTAAALPMVRVWFTVCLAPALSEQTMFH